MPRLTPIENPSNPLMKLAYWLTQRRVGKVISPLKILYARLPFSFAKWIGDIQGLEKKLPLSEELRILIRVYVAQLNTCHFCIDIAQAKAIRQYPDQEKFFEVQNFEASSQFKEAERVALRFAKELTLDKEVTDTTYQQAQQHFSETQLIGIAWLVSSEHIYNMMNSAFEIESDGLCKKPTA